MREPESGVNNNYWTHFCELGHLRRAWALWPALRRAVFAMELLGPGVRK